MYKVEEKSDGFGKVEILQDLRKHLFLARPHGFINPNLLREDLEMAKKFSYECPDHWTYVTNTEDVKLVNPLNILYLKEVKKLKNLKEIAVYAPGFINRLLLILATPIFQADKIFKNKPAFNHFLDSVE